MTHQPGLAGERHAMVDHVAVVLPPDLLRTVLDASGATPVARSRSRTSRSLGVPGGAIKQALS